MKISIFFLQTHQSKLQGLEAYWNNAYFITEPGGTMPLDVLLQTHLHTPLSVLAPPFSDPATRSSSVESYSITLLSLSQLAC